MPTTIVRDSVWTPPYVVVTTPKGRVMSPRCEDCHGPGGCSCADPLAPSRGLLLALLLSVGFWAGVALWVF